MAEQLMNIDIGILSDLSKDHPKEKESNQKLMLRKNAIKLYQILIMLQIMFKVLSPQKSICGMRFGL